MTPALKVLLAPVPYRMRQIPVQRGLEVLSENQRNKPGFDKKESEVLFGKTQYQQS